MSRRKQPNLTEKLAATLLLMCDDEGRPLIDREWAKRHSAKEICALFEFDHDIFYTWKKDDPPEVYNHPAILTPRIADDEARDGVNSEAEFLSHRRKTKRDQGIIARARKRDKAQSPPAAKETGYADVFGQKITKQAAKPKTKWPKGQKITQRTDPWGKRFRSSAPKSRSS